MPYRAVALVATTWLVTSCSVAPSRAADAPEQVRVLSSTPANPALALGARFDQSSRACTVGSVQMLSAEEVEGLVHDWQEPPEGCDGPGKLELPSHGNSPVSTLANGSAHVLVRLDERGGIDTVKAVCATDASFGEAAVETVERIRFSPMTCAGVPTRIAFFVPLDYSLR
ncbi:energy transducer TonB family protein [Lysobacter panacisoli]|nr:energy transducer TonB [Lysobacter panacisoli]